MFKIISLKNFVGIIALIILCLIQVAYHFQSEGDKFEQDYEILRQTVPSDTPIKWDGVVHLYWDEETDVFKDHLNEVVNQLSDTIKLEFEPLGQKIYGGEGIAILTMTEEKFELFLKGIGGSENALTFRKDIQPLEFCNEISFYEGDRATSAFIFINADIDDIYKKWCVTKGLFVMMTNISPEQWAVEELSSASIFNAETVYLTDFDKKFLSKYYDVIE